jgi:anthranilate phosphoribosyltransferase
MKEVLNKLIRHEYLDRAEATRVLEQMAHGKFNACEMAAFLTVYLMRAIQLEELHGFRDAMRLLCVRVEVDEFDGMDVCGTGGDGKDTFNISTLSAFVVAGAGQAVVKHGNYGVSSLVGSSNVLEGMGVKFTSDISVIKKSLEQSGICFLHAPLFHPAMKNVAPVRQQLGIKTFFNMLGPLVNPAFPQKQFVGVFNLNLARMYGYLFQQSDVRFGVVHALDGYDEVSLTGSFKLITNSGESILSPEDLGLATVNARELFGGETLKESMEIFQDILEGKGTQVQRNVVLANAGLALATARELSPQEGIAQAAESLDSGKAKYAFKKFVEINS